jgi:hypothetical protein
MHLGVNLRTRERRSHLPIPAQFGDPLNRQRPQGSSTTRRQTLKRWKSPCRQHLSPTDDAVRSPVWISPCISTGAYVRNRENFQTYFFCPVSVHAAHMRCASPSMQRKPLTLWTKNGLSTFRVTFTTTTIFIFTFKLTNTTAVRTTRTAAQMAMAIWLQALICLQECENAAVAAAKRHPGCKPSRSGSGRHHDRLRETSRRHGIDGQKERVCGKTPVYPQHRMCKTKRFDDIADLVQLPSFAHTRLFQHIGKHVNR